MNVCSSGFGLRGQQQKQRGPDLPLSIFTRTTPICSQSAREIAFSPRVFQVCLIAFSGLNIPEMPPTDQMAEPPHLGPLDVKQ